MAADTEQATGGRRARTRQALFDAGRALIAEKGVAGLRIAEITERAGVALGSFYNHFETKEELVAAVVSETAASLAGAIVDEAPTDDDAVDVVAAALRRFVQLAYDDPQMAGVMVNLSHADRLFLDAVSPFAYRAIERGIAEGHFDPDDLDVAVTVGVGGALALMRAILDGRHGPGADVAHAAMTLRSLGVDAERARRAAARRLPGP
ncbi:MAG TPA: TetR/AcrR family transcriptional regulator [Baekduia sp.]|nr:TetR/AcrR family transcriptional regulator [Baekduia sp.]